MIRRLFLDKNENTTVLICDENKGKSEYRFDEIKYKTALLQENIKSIDEKNIALFLPSEADFICAFFAVIMLGIPVFALNCALTKHEILPLLLQGEVSSIITISKYRRFFDDIAVDKSIKLNVIFIDKLDYFQNNCSLKIVERCEFSPLLMLSTSGTTGKSKIVVLSEKNLETCVFGYINKLDFSDFEFVKYILQAPFFSAYGIMILLVCLIKSFPLFIIDGLFTLSQFYKTINLHKITHFEGGSVALYMMAQLGKRESCFDISSLKFFGFGGSKISGVIVKKVMNLYPDICFLQGYGMSEASPLITKHKHGSIVNENSVGSTILGVDLVIKCGEKIIKKPFIKGEILVKGENVMLGYYNDTEQTMKIIKDGFLHTGDVGYLDENGCLFICGRQKNIIIVRGFNVQAEEVEDVLFNSKFVKDCFVYSNKDDAENEFVVADIVVNCPQITEIVHNDILNYLKEHLAEYKIPQKINFCDKIQKNYSGKTNRVVK